MYSLKIFDLGFCYSRKWPFYNISGAKLGFFLFKYMRTVRYQKLLVTDVFEIQRGAVGFLFLRRNWLINSGTQAKESGLM